jgi:hypothetical protein
LFSFFFSLLFPQFDSLTGTRGLFHPKTASASSYLPKVYNASLGVLGSYASSANLKLKTWHRLIITLDTREYRMSFYVDGTQAYTYSTSSYFYRDGYFGINPKDLTIFNAYVLSVCCVVFVVVRDSFVRSFALLSLSLLSSNNNKKTSIPFPFLLFELFMFFLSFPSLLLHVFDGLFLSSLLLFSFFSSSVCL